MPNTQVFLDRPLTQSADGPFQYATFVVQPEDKPIQSAQVKVSTAALDRFAGIVRETKQEADEGTVRALLADYLSSKIRDWVDAGRPLPDVFDFVASPSRNDAHFVLDPLRVQMFVRQAQKGN